MKKELTCEYCGDTYFQGYENHSRCEGSAKHLYILILELESRIEELEFFLKKGQMK